MNTQETKPKEMIVSELRERMRNLVEDVQDHSSAAFGLMGRWFNHKDYPHNEEAISRLYDNVINMETAWSEIPEGYHLSLGITTEQYDELMKDENLKPLLDYTMRPDQSGIDRWLTFARKTEESAVPVNSRKLQFFATRNTDPNRRPTSLIDLMFVTPSGYERASKYVYPEKITAVKIVKDTL